MYYYTPNRRKSWYRLLSIGQKKLFVLCGLLLVLLLHDDVLLESLGCSRSSAMMLPRVFRCWVLGSVTDHQTLHGFTFFCFLFSLSVPPTSAPLTPKGVGN